MKKFCIKGHLRIYAVIVQPREYISNMSGIVVTLLVFALTYTVCVAQQQQPCGRNEVHQTCGTFCPLTCRNFQNPPGDCAAVCVTGCFCRDGFVRDERRRRCVRPRQCSRQ